MTTKSVTICVVAVIMILSAGCASTCDPVIVKVPVPIYADPLPVPATPAWHTPGADPSDVNSYIRALTHDVIEAWRWGVELRHVIEAHNKAIADEQPTS